MKLIDDFLNNITMYRLVLYFLIVLAVVGFIYSVAGVLPYDPVSYVLSFSFILLVSYIANWVFAHVYEAPVNPESWWISALILGLIITPPATLSGIIFIGWAATLTVAGKFILAIKKKHIFNPVAIAVFLTATFINGTASWWVGTSSMLPVVAIGGFLIARKIKRWDLVLSFLGVTLFTTFVVSLFNHRNFAFSDWRDVTDTSLIFFATVMLTEPMTTPPTRFLRIVYAAIVGFLFAPQVHFGSFYLTPEIALIVGNIFSYIVSPKYKLLLPLREKIRLTSDTWDFVFAIPEPLKFKPGQYMEFTLAHPKSDSRGVRRYLSIASSPTENNLRLGVKIGNPPSSYKKALLTLKPGDNIVASQLIGDFTMPENKYKKLVFIAGGIGITPYRSMLKYLIDKGERRDIVVVYTASGQDQFVYKDILEEAKEKLGIKVIYVDTRVDHHIDSDRLAREIPDYKERTFYISGGHTVVTAFERIIGYLGIPSNQKITDYFPGFA